MIHAVTDTCSVKWSKVNHKVYKFQSLVFNEDKKQFEEVASSVSRTSTLISPSLSNASKDEKNHTNSSTTQVLCHSEEIRSACSSYSKITGPIRWKQVYGEYLGKESEVSEIVRSPNMTRKSIESPPKIARRSPDSPLLRQRKDVQDLRVYKDVSPVKKDQRRVHFEDDVKEDEDEDEVFEQAKKSCLPDCSLCRSIPPRDFSPPYQALIDKSRHCDVQREKRVNQRSKDEVFGV